MSEVHVDSRCGRHRITVSPGEDGTILTCWHWPVGSGNWKFAGRSEVGMPFHQALDHAHRLIADLPPSESSRRGEWNKAGYVEC